MTGRKGWFGFVQARRVAAGSPMAPPASAARRVALFGLLLALLSMVATLLVLWDTHRVAIEGAARSVNEFGIAAGGEVLSRLEAIGFLLRAVQGQTDRLGIVDESGFSREMARVPAAKELLPELLKLGDVSAFAILDASGRVLSSSGAAIRPGWVLPDRFSFTSAGGPGPVLSKPQRSRATGGWTEIVVWPIHASSGTRLGFAVVAIDLAQMSAWLAPESHKIPVAITLLSRDGIVLARRPYVERYIGMQVPAGSGWYSHVAGGGAWYRATGFLKRGRRIVASNVLHGYPLVIDVSLPERAALSVWRREAILIVVSELCVVTMFVVLFRGILRQVRQQATQNASLRATTAALRASEQRLRGYTEIASDWLWERDSSFGLTWASAAAPGYVIEHPGYRDMLSRGAEGSIVDDVWLPHREALNTHRRFRALRCRVTELDGTEHYFGFDGDPVFDGAGVFQGYRGVARDITLQVAAEQELREAKERAETAEKRLLAAVDRLDRAQEIAGVGSWEFDVAAGRWYWSKQMFVILGYPMAAAGLPISELQQVIHLDDRPRFDSWLADLLRGVSRDRIDVRIVRPGHEIRALQADARPIIDADGTVRRLTGTVQDLTERRAIEHRLFQAQAREVVGTLTGGLVHDFNNVLGLIMGNLELLGETLEGGTEAAELARDALAAAHRCRELIRRLLVFARGEDMLPERVDVNAIVVGFAESFLPRLVGKTIEPTLDLETGLWTIIADSTRLESALTNLCANARDAMPGGGQLAIFTRNVRLNGTDPVISPELPAGEYVLVAVSDTGSGMAPSVADRAFEPFFTTKPPERGTGLGLAMVRSFATQCGGGIVVDSELGRGTTIQLYLPRAPDGRLRSKLPRPVASRGGKGQSVGYMSQRPGSHGEAGGSQSASGYVAKL